MNFTFIIDNQLTASQQTYQGLSVLDIEKNAVEFFVKKRLKMPDTKYDTFHLFTSNDLLSSWSNEPQHFFNQLKTIQPSFQADLPWAIKEAFADLNKFRCISGADNYYGGRDCLKIDPAVVMLFTNNMDDTPAFKCLPIRWDQKLFVFYLNVPGAEDQDYSHYDFTSTNIFKEWCSLAESIGCGQCFLVNRYEQIFQLLDEVMMECIAQVSIRLSHMPRTLVDSIKYELLEGSIDKSDLKPELGEELLRSKQMGATLEGFLVRSFLKPASLFSSQRLRCQTNMTIHTQVYLPEQYPLAKASDESVEYPSYPEFYVDFTSTVKVKMTQIPYQELIIQNLVLEQYLKQLTVNQKKKIVQFPIFFLEDKKPRPWAAPTEIKEEPRSPLFIGLVIYDKSKSSIELQFYFPNFPRFTKLYTKAKERPQQVLSKQFETELQQYFLQVPNYYSPCIKKFLAERKVTFNRTFQFYYDDQTQQNYLAWIKGVQNKELQTKSKLDKEYQKQKAAHFQRKSTCCAVLSQTYEQTFKEQLSCRYREITQQLYMKEHTPWKQTIRRMLPDLVCKCNYPPLPVQKWPILKNERISEEEIEFGYEAAFCGNPWRLFKKAFRDGLEIKLGFEQTEYDITQEDQIMTTITTSNQNKVFLKKKNKRKGFLKINNHQKNEELIDSYDQPYDPDNTLEEEHAEPELRSESNDDKRPSHSWMYQSKEELTSSASYWVEKISLKFRDEELKSRKSILLANAKLFFEMQSDEARAVEILNERLVDIQLEEASSIITQKGNEILYNQYN